MTRIDYGAWALQYDNTRGGRHIRNTSLFHPLSPGEVDSVLERIRRDHDSGELARVIDRYRPLVERWGDGAIFVARP